jgi:hypothetical protein
MSRAAMSRAAMSRAAMSRVAAMSGAAMGCAMIAVLLAGCCPKKPDVIVMPIDPPVVNVPVPAGHIADGVFIDAALGLEVPIPPGWQGQPGLDASPVRVVLRSADGAELEVWALGAPGLPEEPGCVWSFDDTGPYGQVKAADPPPLGQPTMPDDGLRRLVADCTQTDPEAPMREVACRAVAARWVCVISVLPTGLLARHRSAGMKLLEAIRPGT